MPKCNCYGRSFKTIRGLNQHVNYTSKISTDQSEACSEILSSMDICSKEININENEWTSNSGGNYENTVNTDSYDMEKEANSSDTTGEFDFNDYVMHHLSSLTNFTRDLFLRMEAQESATVKHNESVIGKLQEEIAYLRKECADKTEIITALSTGHEKHHTDDKTSTASDWEIVSGRNNFTSKTSQLYESTKSKARSPVPTHNRYSGLAFQNTEPECTQNCCLVDSAITHERNNSHSSTTTTNRPTRRAPIVIDKRPENNNIHSWRVNQKKVVPGQGTYSDVSKRGRKIFVAGDSIVKRMLGGTLNRSLKRGRAFVRSYVGATCEEIDYHARAELRKGGVDSLVLVMGQNNVSYRRDNHGNEIVETADEIVKQMISVSLKLRDDFSINDVFICTLTPRRENGLNEKVRNINNLLRQKCKDSGIYIIEQEHNITDEHLADRVHLDSNGMSILTNNIVDTLNNHF